eukprot:CAMPEP_0115665054 /NCGR_PEP_ID=MMETSP0272-20121206/48689_1 /TAXON_ID=71861 /ORGANISM="Scrippsiella trochoidea, Strain CCMP3099" /LENGTH=86 /DNA_ID=CAMNT_0003103483 /DNA_START=314 /DNA_END=574 /DNA_ORIENTATION=+
MWNRGSAIPAHSTSPTPECGVGDRQSLRIQLLPVEGVVLRPDRGKIHILAAVQHCHLRVELDQLLFLQPTIAIQVVETEELEEGLL